MPLTSALAKVREAPFIVDVLRAGDDLAAEAARHGGPRSISLLSSAIDDTSDELTAITAVHALGRIFDDRADAILSDLLSHPRSFLREHAAWAMSSRLPRLDAIGRLVAVVAAGGFSGMLAQRTLQLWARSSADHVALALEGALAAAGAGAPAGDGEPGSRARLVETLGLVPGDLAGRAVLRLADDDSQDGDVRVAAVSALGERSDGLLGPVRQVLDRLGRGDDDLAAVARLASLDRHPGLGRHQAAQSEGTTIAQLFLHADIDRDLSRAGAGDNGGVATLLLRLGDALAADPSVGRVLTLSRGEVRAVEDALRDPAGPTGTHVLAGVPLLRPPSGSAQAWPARIAAERGIRRALRAYGPVDALHLRMADVGSLAAAGVAEELGIPMVFTVAPDPHAVIHSLDLTGGLTRAGFGRADEQEHYWFRARLVQRLAANASHDVLFPRPHLDHDLRSLLGIDRDAEPRRYTVVPEGIDLAVADRAGADVRARGQAAVAELAGLIEGLPADRHGLPLAISAGRLHRVKGMASVVQAWATDPALHRRCNLVIIGGDLDDPSADERGQLDLIDGVVASVPGGAPGLIMAGHRPHDVVAHWLAAARHGTGSLIGAGGIYVCGSLKEEFGLAILEAMAAGLVVVAPQAGGPATYVTHAQTGVLVDTGSPAAIGHGISAALDLAAVPGQDERAAKVRDFVEENYTVQAMASALAGVYAGVSQRVLT